MTLTYAPSRTGLVLGGGGGVLALLPSTANGPTVGVLLGIAGAAGLLESVRRGSRRGVTTGATVLYLNILTAVAAGAGTVVLLVGTVGAVVAWDSATKAVELRRQAPTADTGGVELLHATGTLGVMAVAATASSIIYLLVVLSVPVVVPVVLLLATLALLMVLRR